jgi:hypothetical protein
MTDRPPCPGEGHGKTQPVSVKNQTGLRHAETEIGKLPAETGALNSPRKNRNTRNCRPETEAHRPNPRRYRAVLSNREKSAQRPNCVADDAVTCEPVSGRKGRHTLLKLLTDPRVKRSRCGGIELPAIGIELPATKEHLPSRAAAHPRIRRRRCEHRPQWI